ncbi:MAG: BMP family ABC transporter substrate-binding protein [Zhaonellaceae bacterium]
MAILIPSSPTDGGWGQVGAEGMKYVAKELGIEPVIIEAATADLMKTEAEALAADGFNVIFGHGGQYASPFDEISDAVILTPYLLLRAVILLRIIRCLWALLWSPINLYSRCNRRPA